jgi:hypothetical protein
VPSPTTPLPAGTLYGVAAISSHDVWAVGAATVKSYTGPWSVVTEHWDGTHVHLYPSPNPGPAGAILASAAAASTRAVWAVGATQPPYGTALPQQDVVERWDGTRWQVVRI